MIRKAGEDCNQLQNGGKIEREQEKLKDLYIDTITDTLYMLYERNSVLDTVLINSIKDTHFTVNTIEHHTVNTIE